MTNHRQQKLASRVCCTVAVVGDSRVGKTALVHRFVTGAFKEVYLPTSFDKSFASQEVEKHQVEFVCWDTSGSPAYDSVRSLAYHDSNVFLLCYKIADPISLYNVKNKWLGEIRRHAPEAPIVLCGCQEDLRSDPLTMSHLSKTGRTPVSREQALAICCEIGAVHYVETSARRNATKELKESVAEAFELCASAAIKHINNSGSKPFKRSPSIHSSVSLALFDYGGVPSDGRKDQGLSSNFKRSPSTHSNLSLSSNFRMPTLPAFKRASTASITSLKSPSVASVGIPALFAKQDPPQCNALRTFSPEPVSTASSCSATAACRIPPVISEHEQMDSPTTAFGTFSSPTGGKKKASHLLHRSKLHAGRPRSLCDPVISPSGQQQLSMATTSRGCQSRLQRPTTLFKDGGAVPPPPDQPSPASSLFASPSQAGNYLKHKGEGNLPTRGSSCFFSPMSEVAPKSFFSPTDPCKKFDSLSELGTPSSMVSSPSGQMLIKSPQVDVVWPANAQVRPNCLSRRTSYRTHPKMAIPVATPMSPVGSELSFDMKLQQHQHQPASGSAIPQPPTCQSPQSTTGSDLLQQQNSSSIQELSSISEMSSFAIPTEEASSVSGRLPHPHPAIPVFDQSSKIYESLKSQVSSSSSEESKAVPSDLSDASSVSFKANYQAKKTAAPSSSGKQRATLKRELVCAAPPPERGPLSAASMPDTDDPELINNLNFVSPKSGVYRPSAGRRGKHNCSIM